MKEETFTLSIDEMPPQSHDPKDYEIWQLKAEIERLTNERDLALSNADGVYARLMPEIERLRAALEKFGSHNANCGYYDHESLKCDCGFTAALSHQQSGSKE